MQESIFNLIPQHEQYTTALRKKMTSLVPEHISVHSAAIHGDGGAAVMNAPPSSDCNDNYAMPSKPLTSTGRPVQGAGILHKHEGGFPSNGSEGASQRNPAPSRPGIPRTAVQELDAAEVARRRQLAQMHGSAMHAVLTPEESYRQKMMKSKMVSIICSPAFHCMFCSQADL